MKTAVEWLVEKLSKYNEEMVYLYTQEIRQAKEMENYQACKYAEFCISRREAELSDVDFFTYIDINKNYDSTRKHE